MWEVKILETNMENNLEETSPTMSSQGQTLKYLIDFGQKVKSYLLLAFRIWQCRSSKQTAASEFSCLKWEILPSKSQKVMVYGANLDLSLLLHCWLPKNVFSFFIFTEGT